MKLSLPLNLIFVLTLAFPAHGESQPQCSNVFENSSSQLHSVVNQPSQRPIRGFDLIPYYFEKSKELGHLDSSAPYAVGLRALIMTTTKKRELISVRIQDLEEIHPINRPSSMEKTKQRIANLEAIPEQVLDTSDFLSHDFLQAYSPSKNPIRVVKADSGKYIVFDGNGRLYALREALPEDTKIEVELFSSQSKLMQKLLLKVRSLRGLQ